MFTPEITPPPTPGSSPMEVAYSEPRTEIMLPPSALTVVVPFARVLEKATFV